MNKYETIFSIVGLMTTAPDGRSVQGLVHQIDTLGQDPITATYADKLQEFKKHSDILPVLRAASCLDARMEDLISGITYAEKKLVPIKWPQSTRSALIEGQAIEDRKSNVLGVVETAFAFAQPRKYNPRQPRVADMADMDDQGKITLCERLLFKETIAFFIREGIAKREDEVRGLCKSLLARFGTLDPVDIIDLCKARVKVWRLSCEFLVLLTDVGAGAEYQETLTYLTHSLIA